jgi:hypothetical protein
MGSAHSVGHYRTLAIHWCECGKLAGLKGTLAAAHQELRVGQHQCTIIGLRVPR